jgi:Ca2+-binding EF-hand superfamily protein
MKMFKKLKSFTSHKVLKQATLNFIATRCDNEEIEKQRKYFSGLDQNGDGYISLAELKEGLKG